MTREEAIKVLEKQFDKSCGNYHYQNAEKLDFEDALWMAISALRQQGQERNDPLTLDELRKMDGEPVYSVEITGREEWLFRRDGGFADMYGEFTSDDFMVWDNYGKLWWCYRKKPEEDDRDERKENENV